MTPAASSISSAKHGKEKNLLVHNIQERRDTMKRQSLKLIGMKDGEET